MRSGKSYSCLLRALFCAVISALLIASPAAADCIGGLPVSVDLWVTCDGVTDTVYSGILHPDQETGDFASGPQTASNGIWQVDWNVSGNADPVVSGGYTFFNSSGSIQTFGAIVTLPLAAQVGLDTRTSGTIDIDLNDFNGNGATVTNDNGIPIYQASIDTVPFKSLLDPVTTVIAPAGGTGNADADFGLPGQTHPGPAAVTEIALEFTLTLTPGDMATVSGNFVVLEGTPVPEPAAMIIATLGLAILATRRRR